MLDERAERLPMNTPRTHPRVERPRGLWSRLVWPVFAGAVTAVGLFAAGTSFGILPVLVLYATLSLFAVVTVWGLSLEIGIDRSSVLGLGLYSSLGVLVLVGLGEVQPVYGPVVALLVGLTSPFVLGLLGRTRSRSASRQADEPATGVLVDTAMLNRRFDDIVSQLKASGDFPNW
jgi:hypothetical protein